MDVERYRTAVAHEVVALMDEAMLPPRLKEMLCDCLSAPGRILSAVHSGPWFLLPILCCRSASGGPWEQAVPLAAAMEFLGAGADLLDDLEDGDTKWRVDAQNLHLLATLLSFPTFSLLGLQKRKVGPRKMVQILQVFNNLTFRSGAGQFQDLELEKEPTVSLEKAMETAKLKSASLLQCCCQLGALLGSDNDDSIQLYARFGWHLGCFAQLMNDMRDVLPDSGGKSDLARNKKTVPLVFALTARGADPRAKRVQAFLRGTDETSASEEEARRSLSDMGAIHFTWVLAETERLLALGMLREIEARGHSIEELAKLLQ